MQKKVLVVAAIAGVTLCVEAGFGDFMKKAAAVTDIVTGTTEASATVSTVEQTANAVAHPEQAAANAAQQQVTSATTAAAEAVTVDVGTPGVVNSIDMDELAKRAKANPALVLIDVRTAEEFAAGHLPKAKNIPVSVISKRIGKHVANKATPIYLYCRSGARAQTAGATLISLGYRSVFNAGGIGDWSGELVR